MEKFFWLIAALSSSSILLAKPSGYKVTHGTARIRARENAMHIQTGKKAIINWDNFSIGKGESVHFDQANAKSAVLNRVVGKHKSELLGQLLSNGSVWIINQHGILIGKDAMINTASFLASTLDVSNQDFLANGDVTFFNPGDGDVVHLGSLQCSDGDVTLLAKLVQNNGTIEAPKGHVALASGAKILLKLEGQQKIYIETDFDEGAIQNEGSIRALQTELKSGSLYDCAIHSSGTIDALERVEKGGQVYLTASRGGSGCWRKH